MLSRETAEQYRRMSPSERLRLALQMMREATPLLLKGPPEVVDRRFELLRRQNDERNRRMLEGIARTRKDQGTGGPGGFAGLTTAAESVLLRSTAVGAPHGSDH